MALNLDIKVIEKCRIAPPPSAAPDLTLPLMFYDLQWLVLPPCHHLHFYRFRHPQTTSNSIIPSLKSSLSLVLQHFLPLAGNLICHVDSDRIPELRYMKGDSISLTIAESSENFDYLVGDQQRDPYIFCNLLPQLPGPIVTSGFEESPVFALQVTMFPNSGISIGRTVLHVVGDATTFINFTESWASINKFNGDLLATSGSKPMYDRSVVQDPFNLGRKIFNDTKLFKSHQRSNGIPNSTVCEDGVYTTFILHPSDIIKLKRFVSTQKLSTFNVICALMWSCLSKSLDAVSEKKVENDKQEKLLVYINCRQRLDMLIPQNYFGNCIVPCMVGSTHGKLAGKEGLSVAAVAIKDAIHKRLNDSEGILRGDWIPDSYTQITMAAAEAAAGMLDIVGTTQHNVHNNNNADFGWGKLEKHECVSINPLTIVLLINLSRRFQGACELSIALPKKRMDAFTTIFTDSINTLHMRCTL